MQDTLRKPVSTFQLSAKGIDLLKSIEQARLEPYDDQTGNPITSWVKGATIGYGHLIARDEWNKYADGINQEQADALFMQDVFSEAPDLFVIEKYRKPACVEVQSCVVPASRLQSEPSQRSSLEEAARVGRHEIARRETAVHAEADSGEAAFVLVEDDTQVGIRLQPEVEVEVIDMQRVLVQYLLESVPCSEIQAPPRQGLSAEEVGIRAHHALFENER